MLKVLLTLGFFQLLTMVALLVRTKTIAILLGPELVGVMAVVDKLLAVVAQTLSLSLPFAAVRYLPPLWISAPRDHLVLFRTMRNLLGLLAGVAAIAGIAVTLAFPAVWGVQLAPYRGVVAMGFAGLPVLVFVPFLINAIAGRLQQNLSMLFTVAHAVLAAVAAVLGIWWGGLVGLYLLYALVGMILIGAVARQLGRPVEGVTGEAQRAAAPEPTFNLPAPVWRFAVAMLALTFVTPYASWYVHYSVLKTLGAEPAGWMQAAIGISLAVRSVLGAAHAVFVTPNVNRGGRFEDRMAWANEFQHTLSFLVGVALPPLLLFPHLAVRLLYSKAFLPGAAFVALFVVTETLTLLAGTYQTLVLAADHLAFHVLQNVFSQLLLLGIAVALLPSYGILGAGIAAAAAPVFLLLATTAFLRRRHGLRLPARSVALLAYVLASLAVAGALGVARPDFDPGSLILKVVVYALLLAALLAFLTAADRARLKDLLASLRARVA